MAAAPALGDHRGMRVVAAGVSGFLGTAIVADLRAAGHDVTRLVRRPSAAPDEVRWDPAAGAVDVRLVSRADLVVNLAGAGVDDHRWTDRYRSEIRASRVEPTATLARAIAAGGTRPVLVNASGVGWYGDTGDREVTERSPRGTGFLADVCRDWEAATEPAEQAGARVLRLRTGIVLGRGGGLIARLLPLARYGLAGRLGSGRQYVPWISLADWLAAVRFLVDAGTAGPVNLVGPRPVTNAELTAALGRAVHRPTPFAVPAFALRAALPGFADEAALAGQRALPTVLTEAGFVFAHPTVDAALAAALAG